MKKLLAILLVLCVMISLTGCASFEYGAFGFLFSTFETSYETAPERYGAWDESLGVPAFLPQGVETDTINSYSYTLYNYMDTCYEIFLDITVEETEFDDLIERARAYSDTYEEQPAAYCDGYMEIVFMDAYEPWQDRAFVGQAAIEKVIYNPDTGNIVYVVFHADDTGVYQVSDVAYFERFSINADSYGK